MKTEDLSIRLIEICNEIESLGEEHATLKAVYENVKESSKNILPIIMSSFDDGREKIAENKLDRMARSTDKWKEHQMELFDARLKHYTTASKYEALKLKHEAIRSVLSLEKAKMTML